MPEVRVSRLVVLLLLVAAVAVVVIFFGAGVAFYFKEIRAYMRGYTAAKTPTEALDKFRLAIQNRHYEDAARYTTKPYGDLLKRGHASGAQIGEDIDQIHKFGHNGGILSDKIKIALLRLDPFPKTFKVGPEPEVKKDGKAYGTFEWEPFILSNPTSQAQIDAELMQMDAPMYVNVLMPKSFLFQGKGLRNVVMVKEGEEWKIDIVVDQDWDRVARIYDDKHKTYHSGLSAFIFEMTRERYADKVTFENSVMDKLKAASK